MADSPTMSSSDLGIADDHALAARLATEAGRLLLDIRAELAAAGADAAELKGRTTTSPIAHIADVVTGRS